jgi:hypothetical protein
VKSAEASEVSEVVRSEVFEVLLTEVDEVGEVRRRTGAVSLHLFCLNLFCPSSTCNRMHELS